MPSREKLSDFVGWCGKPITGDEKGKAQICLDRLLQAFGAAKTSSVLAGAYDDWRRLVPIRSSVAEATLWY